MAAYQYVYVMKDVTKPSPAAAKVLRALPSPSFRG